MGLIDDFKLANLIRALSLQIGQLVEYRELGQVSGYDYLSLKKYFNILEKTFICAPLKPFFQNKRKEIVKNPKLYFFDTGLRNFVINDFKDLSSRTDVGGLYENFVFNQLQKQDIPINFWRDKTGAEVDFVLGLNGEKIGMEVKTNAKSVSVSSLNKFAREYQVKHLVVLTRQFNQSASPVRSSLCFLPHWLA